MERSFVRHPPDLPDLDDAHSPDPAHRLTATAAAVLTGSKAAVTAWPSWAVSVGWRTGHARPDRGKRYLGCGIPRKRKQENDACD